MLWALLGMLVPVLIHLFNRARHQVVPFGGMMFVESSLRLRARSLRLHALLLLLVRMAIVALLALAAAGLCSAMPAAGTQKRVVHRVTPSSEAELQALLALGIDDADLVPLLGERNGEVGGDRRLTDASLAG